MIPCRLFLSGFLSYQDPVELNFDGLELACISGPNGAGKSSLLDAITWGLFGEARCRDDDALINSHVNAAEVIFDFAYEGNTYRVQRSKPRGKSTVLEFYVASPEGEWRTLTEKSVRETEARLRNILRMNYDTFINASFFLQGKADQFAQQQPANRKKVLTNVLGLEVWEDYRTVANEKRRKVENDIQSIDLQLEDIEKELSQEEERKARLEEIDRRLGQISALRQAKETELASIQRLATSLDEQKRLLDVLRSQASETEQRIERMKTQRETLLVELSRLRDQLAHFDEIEQAYRRWQEDRARLEELERVAMSFREIEARRSGPQAEIVIAQSGLEQELRGLLAERETIRKSLDELAEIEKGLPLLGDEMLKLQEKIAQRQAMEAEYQLLQQQASAMKVENEQLKQEMLELRERIDALQEVEGAACPLCGQPLAEDERQQLLTSLEAQGKQKGDAYRNNLALQKQGEERRSELQRSITDLSGVDEALRQVNRKHDQAESELARLRSIQENWQANGALRLAHLENILATGDFAHAARDALRQIDQEAALLGYDAAAHDAARKAEQEGRASEQALRDLEGARARVDPLDQQIGSLDESLAAEAKHLETQHKTYRAALEKYESELVNLPDVARAEGELMDLRAEENSLRMEMGMVRQLVSVLDQMRERKIKLTAQRAEWANQVNRLKALERAFSKDGVPALLIEQALPEIEEQANAILDRLSSGGMSVRFKTQRELKTKKEELRETLDIAITDQSGKVREYEMFSGGEAFRVNFAIRLALSRVLAHRAGARLQTLFIDEGFGSQDAEGRQRLIEAINLVRSEFALIIVITHLEDLKDAFPSRIEVEKSVRGSQLRVIK